MSEIVRIGPDGDPAPSRDLVGGKAANLARLAALNLPVPPAFVLPTTLCAALNAGEAQAEEQLRRGLEKGLAYLERAAGLTFGDRRRPLLVSVRSGAAVSMPGMLETVLNVGCTKAALRGLLRWRGNPRLAWDCRRRFLEGYAETVLSLDPQLLERNLAHWLTAETAAGEHDLDGEALERLCGAYEESLAAADRAAPEDAFTQLLASAKAVFGSWNSERAIAYRRLQGLEHLPGTAVTVQAMVFGNADAESGAGVAFSRNPSTGAPEPVVDVLFEAQGEDVVSGRRSPEPESALALRAPAVAAQIRAVLAQVEAAFGDVQDIEFTIESGRLYVLQTRSAKRTPRAALRIALDLQAEGVIDAAEALDRIDRLKTEDLVATRFSGQAKAVARGEPAAPGVASGRLALDSPAAVRGAAAGDPMVLLRRDASTADVEGFNAAVGVLTAIGGRTAHAALVARQMNKPCVVSCAPLQIDMTARTVRLGGVEVREGDWLSVDGETGEVFLGRRDILRQAPEAELEQAARLRPAGAHVHAEAAVP
ncbi:MAG: PEP/pyruvate-binding domain-containing protein [Caulobacteraceae bacterium]|nr:PEP/pyruvate-binding domain-containing protein [Caulobacteraceae bacterium]